MIEVYELLIEPIAHQQRKQLPGHIRQRIKRAPVRIRRVGKRAPMNSNINPDVTARLPTLPTLSPCYHSS
jgi:hypothetical protein